MSRVCTFYKSPKGCNKGDQCNFQHTDDGGIRGGGSSRRSRRGASVVRSSGSPSSPSPIQNQGRPQYPKAPFGMCDYYWSSGQCNQGFGCRYKHERNPATVVAPAETLSAIDTIAPYLTESGLAKVSGQGTDIYYGHDSESNRSPTQVQKALTRFLRDDYRFPHSPDKYAFLLCLTSANSNNKAWVSSIRLFQRNMLTYRSQSNEDGQVIGTSETFDFVIDSSWQLLLSTISSVSIQTVIN